MKLTSKGRGKNYSIGRGLRESALAWIYAGSWPRWIWDHLRPRPAVHEHRLTLSRAGTATRFQRCRLGFASDLHIGPTTPVSILDEAFSLLRAAEPDVLLLGGDYVFLDPTRRTLSTLTALVGSVPCKERIAVLGNHDLWSDDQLIVKALEAGGVSVLINQTHKLPAPWSGISITGLDDPWVGDCRWPIGGRDDSVGRFRIVLCHSPDGLLHVGDGSFDLYLCGHTHGGQISSPWGALVMPDGKLCREFPGGFARFNSGDVFVSRGIGGVELPIRLYAPPDVLIVDVV